jgi:serine/threonine protein kinase
VPNRGSRWHIVCRRGQRVEVPPQLQHSAWRHQRGKPSNYCGRFDRENDACYQANILISDSDPPKAILADFGFTRVASLTMKVSSEDSGTVSFTAPELIHPTKFGLEKGLPSKEADIYALGMTVYQVLTGQWPFYPKREVEVAHAVILGERPPKPKNAEEIGMTEAVWELMTECWREDRTKRPDISQILRIFCNITGEGQATNPAIGVAAHRPDVSDSRISVVSESSSCITVLCK